LVVKHVPDYDLCALANEKAGFGRALSSRAAGNQSNFAFEPIHRICLVGLSSQLSVILGRKRFVKGPHRPAIYERNSSSVFQLGCVEALGEPIVDLSDHRRLASNSRIAASTIEDKDLTRCAGARLAPFLRTCFTDESIPGLFSMD